MAMAKDLKRKSDGNGREYQPLNTVEAEVVGLFVQVARAIGLPGSAGEIYGMLYVSPRPLALEEIIARLGISKGSGSQGLKLLLNMWAIQMVFVPTDRRMHYQVVEDLRQLVVFLRDRLMLQVDAGFSRIERIAGMVKDLPEGDRARVADRISELQSWQKKTRAVLKIVEGE